MKKKILGICLTSILMLMLGNATFAAAYSNDMQKDADENIILEGNEMEPLMAPEWYNIPSNYAELVGWYQELELNYPDYIEVFKANELYDTGTATGGYDLYYVRITNESLGLHKPEVLFLGGPHGNENVGTVGLYWFTDWLFRMAFTDEINEEFSKDYLQWIIDNREIYIEVSHNPYGFDHGPQRYDGNGWDLNREADYDGPGSPTGGIWASVNGQTLREFIDNHLCRVGCDFHGGVRLLIYPWASTHASVSGTSPISGHSYSGAPPDFYYYDASSLRVGDFMGDYGGNLYYNNIGPIYDLISYPVYGGICPWAYGADVEKNPAEDQYVEDETFGNYPGSGILWLSPEMSTIYNVAEYAFGNDTVHRFGAEVRRYVLYETDLAQPYIRWQAGTVENNIVVELDTTVQFNWQVNGSLVVDHTYMQWGTEPDPVNNYDYTTDDYDEHAGDYLGGTGWDGAMNGQTNGTIYSEEIFLDTPGEYYFVAKTQVDQIYAEVLRPDIYGDTSYLRLVKERTDDTYYEMLKGSDGTEEIFGQTWWYNQILHVTVLGDPPEIPKKPEGPTTGKPHEDYTYTTSTTDPDGDQVYYKWRWGDGHYSDWMGHPDGRPYNSGETASASHSWSEEAHYKIRVKAKDILGAETDWSDPLSVTMPRNKAISTPFLQFLEQHPILFQLLQRFLQL
ncbi:MAG: PKD domain-containing protein [Thermoplasmatales archaeon]|nr:PKD domain-containing protein [Thermoplasmatales archaeon]